jgi:SAM-dependent methyltransferase
MNSESQAGQKRADAEFDAYAGNYDEKINEGLGLTGESRAFFAEGRMQWLRKRLSALGCQPENALDFGCGTGGSIPFFFQYLGVRSVRGVDPSAQSLATAKDSAGGLNADFQLPGDYRPDGRFDLAFCNGVFHHIPPPERAEAVRTIAASLAPGGLFAFWENNPWNPVTRFMMSRVEFDRDAVLVWPAQARRMLSAAGFEILFTDFLFVFPHLLAGLRRFEPALCKLPLGGQYMVLCRKP